MRSSSGRLGVDRREAVHHLLDPTIGHRAEQRLEVVEVVIDEAFGDAGATRDAGGGRLKVTFFDQAQHRVGDGGAGAGGASGAPVDLPFEVVTGSRSDRGGGRAWFARSGSGHA